MLLVQFPSLGYFSLSRKYTYFLALACLKSLADLDFSLSMHSHCPVFGTDNLGKFKASYLK